MEYIVPILLCIGSGVFAYMTSHMIEEDKKGKTIPLPWENK